MSRETSITVRVSEDLHKAIKVRVAKESLTLKDYIIKLVEADLDEFYGIDRNEIDWK